MSQFEIQKSKTKSDIVVSDGGIFFNVAMFEHAQRVAKMLASSDMIPDHFRDKVGNCVIALNLAARMKCDPFMLMQNLYIVHGKPGIEAKLAIALVNASGKFTPIQYDFDDGKQKCVAYANQTDNGEMCRSVPVTIQMAKDEGWFSKPGPKWKTMPELMLQYRSAMFFARAYCPEVLLGMQSRDELFDAIDMRSVGGNKFEQMPEIPFTPADFDAEFADEMAEKEWSDFWQRAVDFHAEQKPPIPEDQLKVDIISGEVGKFRAAFIGHAKLEPNNLHDKKEPEIEAKTADTHPSVDPEQAFIDEWWNLKAAGFSTYVFKNLERFRSCSNDARGKAKLKWVKIYPKEAWPLNKAEEPESSTENDPGGPPPEDDDFKNPGADEEFNKLVMTEIWQEMSMLKEKFPHDYTRITAGQTPKTEGRVRYVIAELEQSERDTKGISNGAGGGIPG